MKGTLNMAVFGKEYSRAYDLLYQDKDYAKECDFIEAVFKSCGGKIRRILDLGCGTGGHALILKKRGYDIVGVDRSGEMLKIARSKAKNSGLSMTFIEKEIHNVTLKDKFDAVISMFAVMSYQTTNQAVSTACRIAHKHLVPGGTFLFDCWYGPAVLRDKPGTRFKEVLLGHGEKIRRFTEAMLDTSNHTAEIRFKVLKTRQGQVLEETHESHLMRYFFPQEIKYFLETSGFKDVNFCPFLEFGKPMTDSNWNLAVAAKT